ncbi:MAG: hypothetical protein UGF89_07145 [Acutalibacteraceae bacterium]|nr:hypothetical protein [Acutalibacteraceae bacterium]
MHLIFADFSENNLLTTQIGVDIFYDLKVLDKLLIEHQLMNFIDLPVEKVYLLNSQNINKTLLFETICLDETALNKQLLYLDGSDKVIILKNNVYFESDFKSFLEISIGELLVVEDEDGNPFCIISTVSDIKKILNKNFSVKELFIRAGKLSERQIKDKAYIKPLQNVKDYKALINDIINGKTSYKPPFIAEGVFTESVMPDGDFSIIPPVYIGTGVQIESGSTIGPNTVIYGNSLISENTFVKNSVLFDNVYISSNCYIDGSVCCNNASVKRNTAVFSGSVIGIDTLIGEDMTVENNSIINKNVKYDKFNKSPFTSKNTFSFNNKFQGLSPDKVALLGSAIASVFKNSKIIVASDGQVNSLSLKLAFMSGFIASGGECIDAGVMFKSQILFCSAFCECDYSVFFSGIGGGTDVTIYDSEFQELNKSECSNLFEFCNNGKINYVSEEQCKPIRQIKGLTRVYIREITSFSETELPYINGIFCENKHLVKTLESVLKTCAKNYNDEHKVYVYMNDSGTNVNIKFDGVIYSEKILRKIVFFYLRSEKKHFFQSDCYNNLWKYDAVILLLHVLNIMKRTALTLPDLVSNLPNYFIKRKTIESKDNNSTIASKISCDYPIVYKNNCFNIACDNGFVKLKKSEKSNNIKILCSSENMDVSNELCNIFCGFLQ